MGVLDIPKAVYKAQQAKKKMAKIEAAGKEGMIAVLMNGINEVVEVEVDKEILKIAVSESDVEKLAADIERDIKGAMNNAKKALEKELIKTTNLDDLKGLLG